MKSIKSKQRKAAKAKKRFKKNKKETRIKKAEAKVAFKKAVRLLGNAVKAEESIRAVTPSAKESMEYGKPEFDPETFVDTTPKEQPNFMIDGIGYNGTQKSIAEQVGVSPTTLINRCKSDKYPKWIRNK